MVMVRRFLVCFFMLCACSAYAANGGNGGDGGMGITRMGAMALMAARPRLDAMGAPAERSLTRPENFISRHKRAVQSGQQDAMKSARH
jgi:hypothetical protein